MTSFTYKFRDLAVSIDGVDWYVTGSAEIYRPREGIHAPLQGIRIDRLDRLESGGVTEHANFPLDLLDSLQRISFEIDISTSLEADPKVSEWFESELEACL